MTFVQEWCVVVGGVFFCLLQLYECKNNRTRVASHSGFVQGCNKGRVLGDTKRARGVDGRLLWVVGVKRVSFVPSK